MEERPPPRARSRKSSFSTAISPILVFVRVISRSRSSVPRLRRPTRLYDSFSPLVVSTSCSAAGVADPGQVAVQTVTLPLRPRRSWIAHSPMAPDVSVLYGRSAGPTA